MSDDNGNRSLSALPHDNGAVTAIGAVAALSVVAMLRRRGGSNIPGPYARSASLNKRRSREGRYYDRKSDMYLSREDTPGM